MRQESKTQLGLSPKLFSGLHLVSLLLLGGDLSAQTLISSPGFFDPDFTARRPGSGSLISLTVDTTPYTPADQSAGNVTWTHTAGGLVQAGTSVPLVGTVDVQLAAYTQTLGDSLVFGRELETTTTGLIGDLGATITGLTDQVVGASAINAWIGSSTVTGLGLTQGQTYSVTFDVQAGAGINLNALNSASFSLFNGGIPIENLSSTETLNVLDLVQLGGGLATITFDFVALDPYDELTFRFAADTISDVNLLGAITDNQTVLEFSNFTLAPVPEAGSLFFALLGLLIQLRRKRWMA
ncbi:MAG: hypothetical protein CJBNEKGG_02796 [Prosthecobacter sp.]|nr:hypothetical protein [Prosthecobacter sp.]